METRFWVFQTWEQADKAVLGALKQKKNGLCVWGWEKCSWRWDGAWSSDQVLCVWAQQLRLTHLLLSRGAGGEGVGFQAGRRWAGDRDSCLRWGFSHVGPQSLRGQHASGRTQCLKESLGEKTVFTLFLYVQLLIHCVYNSWNCDSVIGSYLDNAQLWQFIFLWHWLIHDLLKSQTSITSRSFN